MHGISACYLIPELRHRGQRPEELLFTMSLIPEDFEPPCAHVRVPMTMKLSVYLGILTCHTPKLATLGH